MTCAPTVIRSDVMMMREARADGMDLMDLVIDDALDYLDQFYPSNALLIHLNQCLIKKEA